MHESVVSDINSRKEHLATLQPQYRLYRSAEFSALKKGITETIRNNGINVRQELEPHVYNLYRRFFRLILVCEPGIFYNEK